MVFREVSVIEVREALRAWLAGKSERAVAAQAGVDRKTSRRYVRAAVAAGLPCPGATLTPHRRLGHLRVRGGGEAQSRRFLPRVVHDAVVAAAGAGSCGAGAVPGEHLRGGPAVQLHQVPLGATAVQPGVAEVIKDRRPPGSMTGHLRCSRTILALRGRTWT